AEAIAALLRSWHKEYYRWRPAKAKSLVAELRELIMEQSETLGELHARLLSELDASDRPAILRLFPLFESKLGPVGTAKALNLLAPNFFPLWDSDIAFEYGVSLGPRGYFLFMAVTAHQVRNVDSDKLPDGMDLLKTLDEYNYCRYTMGWIT